MELDGVAASLPPPPPQAYRLAIVLASARRTKKWLGLGMCYLTIKPWRVVVSGVVSARMC